MDTIDFALVLHNHQPVGNKDEIIEKVYRQSYLPFLKVLEDHPAIRANIHYSGFLLEWLERNHGEIVELLRNLVDRQSVEIIGGAYYEPIVASIPDVDALGQVELLQKTIKRLFGSEPQGFWTAERAWEPQIPEILQKCNVKYTMLDDDIFAGSGIFGDECFRPYLVESRGSCTSIFPMLKRLRYLIPFKPANQTIEYLRRNATQHSPIAVSGDDGEKFGAWPNTYHQVYTERWLDRFFTLVEKNNSWLRTVRLSDSLSKFPPRERTYLGTSSYPELMEWSIRSFGKKRKDKTHGFWRLFLSKYPESARMYSKMLWTSHMIHEMREKKPVGLLELWKGQCNDSYWHGIFGGLYSPVLRRLTYSHLINAQKMAERNRSAEHSSFEEISLNGSREYLLNTKFIGARLCPKVGGSLSALDHKPSNTNLFDTLARRPESYHAEIKKRTNQSGSHGKKIRSIHDAPKSLEKGLENLLVYDRQERLSFMDHIFEQETSADDYETQTQREQVVLTDDYDCRIKQDDSSIRAKLSKRAMTKSGELIEIVKEITVPNIGSNIEVNYDLKLITGNMLSSKIGVEINIGSLGDSSFIRQNLRKKVVSNVRSVSLVHPQIGLKSDFVIDNPANLWQFPIRTVSNTEAGFESNLQDVCLIFSKDVDLKKNEVFSNRIRLQMTGAGR